MEPLEELPEAVADLGERFVERKMFAEVILPLEPQVFCRVLFRGVGSKQQTRHGPLWRSVGRMSPQCGAASSLERRAAPLSSIPGVPGPPEQFGQPPDADANPLGSPAAGQKVTACQAQSAHQSEKSLGGAPRLSGSPRRPAG